MGYSLIATFKAGDEQVFKCYADWLKILQSGRYTSFLGDIDFETTAENKTVYNKLAFKSAYENEKRFFQEKSKKLEKLNSMLESIEFYKLSEEQKQNVYDDIDCFQEAVKESDYKLAAFEKIVSLFDILQEDEILDDDGSYGRDLEVKLEVECV